jgi:hypothetical protein
MMEILHSEGKGKAGLLIRNKNQTITYVRNDLEFSKLGGYELGTN